MKSQQYLQTQPCAHSSDVLEHSRATRISPLEALLAVGAVSFYVLCFTTAAFAKERSSERRTTAVAAFSPVKPEQRNGDYLNEVASPEQDGPEQDAIEPQYNTNIFENSVSKEMIERYRSFHDAYAAREPYQLNDQADMLRHFEASRDFSQWALRKLIQYHLDHTVKQNLEKEFKRKASQKSGPATDRAAAQTVMTLSAVSKMMRGTTLKFSEKTKTKFKFDLARGSMAFALTSPLLNAGMDFNSNTSLRGERQPGEIPPERLSVHMNRRIEEVGASTAVRYSLSSETLNYGIKKDILDSLSAQVDQAHYMRDTSKDETVFRVNFGTRF